MRILNTIREGLRTEMKADPRLFGSTVGSARANFWNIQPGSAYDYASAAGDLWANGIVLAAINMKARVLSECSVVVEEKTAEGWRRLPDTQRGVSELLSALNEPNPYYDGLAMWWGLQMSWDVRGHAFLLKRRDNLGRVIGFYWVSHTQMEVANDKDNADGTKLVTHYRYTPINGTPRDIPLEDVVMVRQGIDPKDPRCGYSTLAGELRSVASDNEASTYMGALLRNAGIPGVIVMPEGDLPEAPNDVQRSAMRDFFDSFARDKRGKPAVLPFKGRLEKPAFSPRDMELGPFSQIPINRICVAFGFDPMVLGLPSTSKTYSNYNEAIDAAGKLTILPGARAQIRQIGRSILQDFGFDPKRYRLGWDTSDASWLQDETNDLHQRVREDYKSGVIDLATAKREIGLEPLPGDEGTYHPSASSLMPPLVKSHAERVKRSHEALKGLV